MFHTLLAQYYHTRILQRFSYRNLSIDQFVEVDFLCPVADVIHGFDPYQLIVCFQLLIDAIFLCHLCYKQIELCSCLSVDVNKVAVQLTIENEGVVEYRTVFSEVLLVLSTPHTNGVDFFFWNGQTHQIIISMQFISKSVTVVVDVIFHSANLRVSFICGSAERL